MENIAQRLHHIAYITWDMDRTAQFWTEVMGLKLAAHVSLPKVPSTGEDYPYLHMFFSLKDGSDLAFFEVRNVLESSQEVGVSNAFKHIAFEVESEEDLNEYRQRLEVHNIQYSGPEEDSLNRSITFFDPNQIKILITLPLRKPGEVDQVLARKLVEEWVSQKKDSNVPLGIASAAV